MNTELTQMTEADFSKYLNRAIPNYANEKIKGEGLGEEEAKKIAESSFSSLLPDGVHTKNHYLFTVIEKNTDSKIGILWFAKKQTALKKYAFIYDIELDSSYRGKGYGKQVMALVENEVKKHDLNSIGLHVFGHNKTAINLYEKTGYRVTNQTMIKDLT